MDWIPIVFATFKGIVLITGMFFAIKWHYDQGKKGKRTEMRTVLRASGKVIALFLVSLVVLGMFTYYLINAVGLDMTLT